MLFSKKKHPWLFDAKNQQLERQRLGMLFNLSKVSRQQNMEYVHLKDMRASAFEPANVLSGYKYQSGLRYYESTRDAATNFFIDYLPKGAYVIEYGYGFFIFYDIVYYNLFRHLFRHF